MNRLSVTFNIVESPDDHYTLTAFEEGDSWNVTGWKRASAQHWDVAGATPQDAIIKTIALILGKDA